jgi:hypothetical protein
MCCMDLVCAPNRASLRALFRYWLGGCRTLTWRTRGDQGMRHITLATDGTTRIIYYIDSRQNNLGYYQRLRVFLGLTELQECSHGKRMVGDHLLSFCK